MSIQSEGITGAVCNTAKQPEETRPREWSWVERTVWTERMLEALENGLKGGIWFSLIDKVMRVNTLRLACRKVAANGGSAGTDHQSVADFAANLEENLSKLAAELRAGTYRPRPIRRVYIDKPGSSEKRPLGIPAVRDRVVQGAIRLVVEPILEMESLPCSYGFRPGRGCKDALRRVDQLLREGYLYVVDADIKAYFDSIPQDLLMKELRRYVADGRILSLVEQYLEQEIWDGVAKWRPETGTPQGAVLSPMLANLYLHPVDAALTETGCIMVRYADDLVILSRSLEGAEAALAQLQNLLTERGLTLHPQKTRIADLTVPGDDFEFLGYHFIRSSRTGRLTRWPRKKSLKKFKDRLRGKTKRSSGQSLLVIVDSDNKTTKGWFEYFKHSNKYTFIRLDQ